MRVRVGQTVQCETCYFFLMVSEVSGNHDVVKITHPRDVPYSDKKVPSKCPSSGKEFLVKAEQLFRWIEVDEIPKEPKK